MRFNQDSAERFFNSLAAEQSPRIQFQLFSDTRAQGSAQTWCDTLLASAGALRSAQTDSKLGVYFTVNKTDGRGRATGNITAVRACFLDFDDQDYPPHWPINPNWIIGRDAKNFHVYFLLAMGQDLGLWPIVQYQLALYYSVKDKLHDLPRVMRVPGFYNLKEPLNPRLYDVQYYDPSENRYTLQQLIDAHPLTDLQQKQLNSWSNAPVFDSRPGITTGELDATADVLRYRAYLDVIGVPLRGERNNVQFQVSAMAKDYALSLDKTLEEVLRWRELSWGDVGDPSAVGAIVRNAYKYGRSAPGSATAAGAFSKLPIPELPASALAARALAQAPQQPRTSALAGLAYSKNQSQNAELFLDAAVQNQVYFCTVRQETYIYSGTHWRRIDIEALESLVLRSMADAKPNIDCVRGTAKIIKLMTCDATIEQVPSWISSTSDSHLGHHACDLIPFKNGLLNIKTGELIPHTRDFFHTYCLDFNYDPHAACDNWRNYLLGVFQDDFDVVACMQEWFGYQLVATYEHQKIAMFIGAPRSGKGTITSMLIHLVGESNVAAPSLDSLASHPILDYMSDKPVAVIGDACDPHPMQRTAVLGILKTISGGDRVTYNRKYLGSVTTRIPARFTICANALPSFIDSSGAFAGRLLLFPFRQTFLEREDIELLPRLMCESSGIINWAIQGLIRLRANRRFTASGTARSYALDVAELTSPVAAFIYDCLDVPGGSIDQIAISELMREYKSWCFRNDLVPLHTPRFQAALLAAAPGARLARGSVGLKAPERTITGIRLRTP